MSDKDAFLDDFAKVQGRHGRAIALNIEFQPDAGADASGWWMVSDWFSGCVGHGLSVNVAVDSWRQDVHRTYQDLTSGHWDGTLTPEMEDRRLRIAAVWGPAE